MDLPCIVALVAGIILLLVVGWEIARRHLRRLADRVRNDVVAGLGEDNILLLDPAANCFGVKSLGAGQVRGNGCWALTRDRIFFKYWVGTREVEIPLRQVTGTRIAKGFLGRTMGRPVLVLAYRNEQGQEDECAWMFKDMETVKQRLDELRPK